MLSFFGFSNLYVRRERRFWELIFFIEGDGFKLRREFIFFFVINLGEERIMRIEGSF